MKQDTSDISLEWQEEMTTMRRCFSQITPQSTSTMHSGDLSVGPFSRKNIGMKSYTTSAEY